jgi:hypothetical protein
VAYLLLAHEETRKEPKIGIVTPVTCRSYSALTFDGCPSCVDAALAATGQAAAYVLGRTAPGLSSQSNGPVDVSYVLRVRLLSDLGELIGADELEVAQTVEAVAVDDFSGPSLDSWDDAVEAEDTSMRLEDFQTIVDRLELAPAGRRGLCGSIGGALYAFERLVGRFDVEVSPAR